jgi:hypothetical protein
MQSQNYFVSKQYILSQVTQESIFEFYFGQKIDLAKKYKSPLREDKTPGCSFFYGQSGDLLFFDSQEGNCDCFRFIMLKFRCSYYDAIIKIKMDFKLIKSANIKIINEEKEPYLKDIAIKRKQFTPRELEFWQLPDMVISEELLAAYGIFSISDLWFNGVYKGYNLVDTFAFKQDFPYHYQIYRPYADKTLKFRTNDGSYIYGWHRLNDSEDVYINKGPKDNFFASVIGYNSIGPMGEGFNIPEDKIAYLKGKYKRIFLCYDNDDAGKKYTEKIIKQYPFIIPKFPPDEFKDFTEAAKIKGAEWMKINW